MKQKWKKIPAINSSVPIKLPKLDIFKCKHKNITISQTNVRFYVYVEPWKFLRFLCSLFFSLTFENACTRHEVQKPSHIYIYI